MSAPPGVSPAALRSEIAYHCFGYGSSETELTDFIAGPFDQANVPLGYGRPLS